MNEAKRQVASGRGRDHDPWQEHWLWRAIDANGNVLDVLMQNIGLRKLQGGF
ncbi:MAG: hypothetical protein ACI9RO_001637 [Alteromonas macleodii]